MLDFVKSLPIPVLVLSCIVIYILIGMVVSFVSEYHYEINFNPKMWLPYAPTYVD